MFCSKCGKEIDENAEKCPFCDEKISSKKPIDKKKIMIISGIALAVIIALIIIISASGMSKTKSSDTVVKQETNAQTTQQESNSSNTVVKQETTEAKKLEQIGIDDEVNASGLIFTLRDVELSYEVEPDIKPSYYHYYSAESGHVYIHIDADVENTNKQSFDCDELYDVVANYDDGYKYKGFAVAEDYDGDFRNAGFVRLDPLQTNGVHYLIDCPVAVDESDKSIVLTFTFKDGSQYEYKMR